ncbi:MAG: FecR domain-containing protein, partial [Bacteroidota bacterium]
MDQDRIGILLAKLLAGEATPPEQKELESAFREDSSLEETWNTLKALKELPPAGLSTEEEQKMLERGLRRLDFSRENQAPAPFLAPAPTTRRLPHYRWMVAAAIVFVLAIAGVLLYSGGSHSKTIPLPIASKELVSKYGSRSYIELPDGSRLWLNAGSKVQYAAAFADGKRELTLSGEAYFDVKHDPAHPFIIHTGRLDVKVLGTTFNIKAYPGDSLTETTLIKGKVEVDFAGDIHSAIVLKPSEKLIVSTATNQSALPSASPAASEKVSEKAQPAPTVRPVVPDPTDGTI